MESPASKHTFTVAPSDAIKKFADEQLAPHSNKRSNEIFLVYASKQLEMESTFEEQWVEDKAEIMCVYIENSEFELQSSTFSKPSFTSRERDADTSEKSVEAFGPGKGGQIGWDKNAKPKKPTVPAAGPPISDTTIPAPANIVTKKNIPKEANPEDLKSGALPPPSGGTIGIDSRENFHVNEREGSKYRAEGEER